MEEIRVTQRIGINGSPLILSCHYLVLAGKEQIRAMEEWAEGHTFLMCINTDTDELVQIWSAYLVTTK